MFQFKFSFLYCVYILDPHVMFKNIQNHKANTYQHLMSLRKQRILLFPKPIKGSLRFARSPSSLFLTAQLKGMHQAPEFRQGWDSSAKKMDQLCIAKLQRGGSCAIIMLEVKVSSGHRQYSRICLLTAKRDAGSPFHYWFIFNGQGELRGESVTWQHLQLSGCVQSEY